MSARRGRRRVERSSGLGAAKSSLQLFAVGIAIVVALWPLWPVYGHPSFFLAVLGGLLGGLLVAFLGAWQRWNVLGISAATFVVFLALGVPLAVPSRAIAGVLPSVQGLTELLAAVALSWKQLLTIAIPVGPYQALLVPAFVLALLGAVVSGTLALRVQRPELAVIVPVVLFVVAILFGATAAESPIQNALALFVISLLWMLGTRVSGRRKRLQAARAASSSSRIARRLLSARALAAGAAMVAASLAIGTAATVLVPPSQAREVLRSEIRQAFNPRAFASPLSSFRAEQREPRADELLLTVTGLPEGVRLRVAALDSYDGIVYSVGSAASSATSGDFTRLPYRLDQSAASGERLSISVVLAALGGVWVPGVGPLESIRFGGARANALDDAFYYNDVVATAAVLPGLEPGDRFSSVGVAVPEIEQNDLSSLDPGRAVLPSSSAEVDGVREALERWTNPDTSAGENLAAVIAGLTSEGYVSHGIGPEEAPSRSGHGADRITELFAEVPMVGDGEQYAVAAALLARELGFPARVVVGFAPEGERQADAPLELHGSDVSAWIEVQDSRLGWVAIDPNPPVREVPEQQPDDPIEVSRPQSVVPPPVQDRLEDRDPPAPDLSEDEEGPEDDAFLAVLFAVLGIVAWSLLGLLVLAAPFLAVVIAKVRRRRIRRSAASPIARIEGGWRELADTAADNGVSVPLVATRSEQARFVGEGSVALAELVDRASFAPEEPSDEQADGAWRSVDLLRGELAVGQTRRQRLRSLVSLKSFTRYAGGEKEGEK